MIKQMVIVATSGLILTIVMLIMSVTVENAIASKAVVKKPKPDVGTWHYQTRSEVHEAELLPKPH
jgi:hypothetical protein